jgi:hypothetical protein
MTREEAIRDLGLQIKQVGALPKTYCYNTGGHKNGDNHPSLTLYDNGYNCFACGEHGTYEWLVKQFKGGNALPMRKAPMEQPKIYKKYDLMAVWASLPDLPEETREMLAAKGFAKEQLEDNVGWRWHMSEIDGWGPGIFMPYRAGDEIVGARLRRLQGDPRFLSLPGGESWPYCYNQLTKPYVFVTEGETDCLTLNFAGVPAVGIPGSTNTESIKKTVAAAGKHGTKLYVIGDNDEAGGKFRERVLAAAFRSDVPVQAFMLPTHYKDVNDWFVGAGAEVALERVVAWLMSVDDDFAERVNERAAANAV